MSHVSVIDHFS